MLWADFFEHTVPAPETYGLNKVFQVRVPREEDEEAARREDHALLRRSFSAPVIPPLLPQREGLGRGDIHPLRAADKGEDVQIPAVVFKQPPLV